MIKSSGATERRGPVVAPPCDKFTGAGDSTRRTDGLRDADVPTEDWRCWHGLLPRALSSSSFISPQSACLSASVARPNSDTVRTPTQTRKGRRRRRREREEKKRSREIILVDACHEATLLSLLPLVIYLSLLCYFLKPIHFHTTPPSSTSRVLNPVSCLFATGPLIEY